MQPLPAPTEYSMLLNALGSLQENGVDRATTVRELRLGAPTAKLLPLKFVDAAEKAPKYEDVLDECMLESLKGFDKLEGKTVLLIDNSREMYETEIFIAGQVISMAQAAQILAVIAREIFENVSIYVFAEDFVTIPPIPRGIALANAIRTCTSGGKNLNAAIDVAGEREDYDRLIVITDEQTGGAIRPPNPETIAYLINLAAIEYSVSYDRFVKIEGFTERVFQFIQRLEAGG